MRVGVFVQALGVVIAARERVQPVESARFRVIVPGPQIIILGVTGLGAPSPRPPPRVGRVERRTTAGTRRRLETGCQRPGREVWITAAERCLPPFSMNTGMIRYRNVNVKGKLC